MHNYYRYCIVSDQWTLVMVFVSCKSDFKIDFLPSDTICPSTAVTIEKTNINEQRCTEVQNPRYILNCYLGMKAYLEQKTLVLHKHKSNS